MAPRPALLCILDGWGWRTDTRDNAIAAANTPNYTRLLADCPHALLQTSGKAVGLPAGQMGNSEVGHMNIGSGRVVTQDLPRIDAAIADGSLEKNPELQKFIASVNDLPPEALPSVCKRDLERAWHAAREAALAERQGAVRGFRFNRPDGSHTDLALADPDASCWVGAVDRMAGIANAPGLSLCLRLLALIDLLAHAPWARSLFHLARDGAEFHPALLRTAATQPLTRDARFDEAGFLLGEVIQ